MFWKWTELTLGLMFVEMGRRDPWKRKGGGTLFRIFYVLLIWFGNSFSDQLIILVEIFLREWDGRIDELRTSEAATGVCFVKKGVLKNIPNFTVFRSAL